jgi:hypothetical protein
MMTMKTWNLAVIALFLCLLMVAGSASAAEEDEEEDSESIWEWIKGFVTAFIDTLVSVVTAPFKAIAEIFGNWAGTMAHWYGPIVAVFVLAVSWFMIRVVSEFDEWLDLNN